MQSNIFKATNEGKGIIFLPHDKDEHPIIGACISPRESALDTIELPGATLPEWVTEARDAAGYDDTADHMVPPRVTTATGVIRPIELEAYGGYNLKVAGEVCPMHPTQGILRNGGKLFTKAYRLVKHTVTCGDNYDDLTRPFWRVPNELHSIYASKAHGWCGPVGLLTDTVGRLPKVYVGGYMYDAMPNNYDVYLGAVVRQSIQDQGSSAILNVTVPPEVPFSWNLQYFYYYTEVQEIDNTFTPQATTNLSAYHQSVDNSIIFWAHDGILNSGVNYSLTGGTATFGTHSVSADLTRNTDAGFLSGTPKGMVVNNELRRNFLRISPTVFKHIGDY